ncbi:MAG: Asp-tRNA(Asn)/Glu-tRNA(Gln) amidotransferase subunit GatC [Deltaproteobacteria bacterium]|nr:Asp-tRNA(Asn)/Glu-tRNA(Gln) amidotransferase subunit GatC [Deltaproteobacteria bacterium]
MSAVRISLEDVRHVAKLARLSLDEQEIETMRKQLDSILDYMASLEQLDLAAVEPTFYSVAMQAPLRTDVIQPSLRRDEALRAAPMEKAGAFAVPKVMDGEG